MKAERGCEVEQIETVGKAIDTLELYEEVRTNRGSRQGNGMLQMACCKESTVECAGIQN